MVHMHGFVFGREAIGKLMLSLWKFVNEDHGVITRSDTAGDIRMTVDFSTLFRLPISIISLTSQTVSAAAESVSLS